MSTDFIHLRLHTEYSLIDGMVRIKPLIKQVAKIGMPAVAVTYMSNLFALIKFYKAAHGAGIKPIKDRHLIGISKFLGGPDPGLEFNEVLL